MGHENSFMKRLIRSYLVFGFKNFYSDFIVIGEENIPAEGPVIFAPNHINALMDAIAVHAICPKKTSLTFLARADIFNNKKLAAILQYLGLLPAFRIRDGVENLAKNEASFAKCVELLHNNCALGIMPEGNQGDERKIRPLGKGIFRIAFAAQEQYGVESAVKIVPIGIDYGHLHKFGRHIIISIGKPIDMAEYMSSYAENPVNTTNNIRQELYNALDELTVNIASDKNYHCIETATEVAITSEIKDYEGTEIPLVRFAARQRITKKILLLEKHNPTEMAQLDELCTDYSQLLQLNELHSSTLEHAPLSFFALVKQTSILVITSPFFALGWLLNVLPFYTPVYIRKKLNVQYKGFFSSIHYALGVFTFPLFYQLQTLLINAVYNLTWVEMIISIVAQFLLGKAAFSWYTTNRKLKVDMAYRELELKHPTVFKQIEKLRGKIIELVNAE